MTLAVLLLFLLQHLTLKNVNGKNIYSGPLGNGQNNDIKTLGNGHSIDNDTLARIFTFFDQNYKRVENGAECQFAAAINVPKEQCQAGFKPTEKYFLTQDDPKFVKWSIRNKKDPVYQGEELIEAGVRLMKGGKRKHSEYLLLNPTDERPRTPMQYLLNKRKDSCTIFYTFNSPCADTCLNESSKYNILQGIQNWSQHDSIKALVFKQIWTHDEDRKEVLKAALKNIVGRNVSVYRCINENGNVCYACGGKEDSLIDEHCLLNP